MERKKSWGKIALAAGGHNGFLLIDTVVALALLGIFGVAFLSAISTSTKTRDGINDKVNVDNLARAQLEYTKNANSSPYHSVPHNYQTLDHLSPSDPYAITVPPGYSINVTAVALHNPDDGIQKITVAIFRNGNNEITINDFKVNR